MNVGRSSVVVARIKGILVAALLLFALVGCVARINRVMDSWVGSQASDLMAKWGPPDQTMDDGAGGRILIYTQIRSYTTPGTATTQSTSSTTASTVYSPPQTQSWKAHRMFWVNK